jgi:soluble lytic murein transglycosylase-like protein
MRRFRDYKLGIGTLILTLLSSHTLWGADLPNIERRRQEYFVGFYCHRYSVSEAWVRAIITVESNWLPDAVSEKGAAGLMQLMPGTAMRFGVRNRFDSAANIEGGVKYLAFLLAHFKDDRIRATAAYFTGEARIEGRTVTDFAPEVLAYVKKVYYNLTEETLKKSLERPAVHLQLHWPDPPFATPLTF